MQKVERMVWESGSLQSRIEDAPTRRRFSAGCPSDLELQVYERELEGLSEAGVALVLGMTPELRQLAVERFQAVVTIDASQEAIELYRDWLPLPLRRRETIVCGSWSLLADHAAEIEQPICVVLGDGVFGNMIGREAHLNLLTAIGNVMAVGGRLITRHAAYPVGYDFEANTAMRLLEMFRRGQMDEAEFGFAMRMTGHALEAYDPSSGRLQNHVIFRWCNAARSRGELNEQEYAIIHRYYFGGDNCIYSQDIWENLLQQVGFTWQKTTLTGKHWYAYYPLYTCVPSVVV